MIRCVYAAEPSFPPTDQAENAQRVQIGNVWVDYVGVAPTQADVDAVLSPPDEPRIAALKGNVSVQNVIAQLQTATDAQIDAWFAANVTTLGQARGVLATIVKIMAVFLRIT